MQKNVLFFLTVLFSLSLFSQTYTGGIIDDGLDHYDSNYPGFAPPLKGQSYIDPAFGTTVTRLTNGKNDYNDAIHHEYATMNAFNANDSLIAVVGDNTGWIIIDKKGNVIDANPPGRGPRWSPTDPNIYYYYNYNDNVLRMYNVSTKTSSKVHTFNQYNFITWGGGEDDISKDGDHLVIMGDDTYVGVYEISTDIFGPTLEVASQGGIDWADLTASNMVVIRWGRTDTIGDHYGYCLYDTQMNFVKQLVTWGAHADRGSDPNGNDVVFAGAYSDVNPPTNCETNGGMVINNSGNKSCVLSGDWNFEMHLSANAHNGWGLISYFDGRTTNGTASGTLPNNWQSLWDKYYNEVILVKLDGSETRRICHHYSRTIGSYWQYPRVSMSRSGKYALFDSNFGNDHGINDYTDVYMVDLGLSVVTSKNQVANYLTTNINVISTQPYLFVEVINPSLAGTQFKLMDINGKLLKSSSNNSATTFYEKIETSDCSNGVYFLEIRNGDFFQVKKVFIQ